MNDYQRARLELTRGAIAQGWTESTVANVLAAADAPFREYADKWDRIADEAIVDGGPITKHGVALSAADILKLCAGDIKRLVMPAKK